jgi:hypothetical protein
MTVPGDVSIGARSRSRFKSWVTFPAVLHIGEMFNRSNLGPFGSSYPVISGLQNFHRGWTLVGLGLG